MSALDWLKLALAAAALGWAAHAWSDLSDKRQACAARGGVLVRGVGFDRYECAEARK